METPIYKAVSIYIYMHMHICMLRQGGAGRLETLNPQGLMLRASRHM